MTWDDVPGANTPWQVVDGSTLAPGQPRDDRLGKWRGPALYAQLRGGRQLHVHHHPAVENTGTDTARMAPYSLLSRHGEPSDLENFFISHEGFVEVADGTLTEESYGDVRDFAWMSAKHHARVVEVQNNGWLGIADKYWMATIVPMPGDAFTACRATCPPATSIRPAPTCRP